MLRVAPCSYEAAKYAVEHWHYSKRPPAGRLVKFGVWEADQFIGAVVYGRGASPYLGTKLGLQQTELCELVRVALTAHKVPVTQVVAEAMKLLRAGSPGLRAVVSFADPAAGHVGKIYQAGNWIYLGQTEGNTDALVRGRWVHSRNWQEFPKVTRDALPKRYTPGKFRYVMPFDKALRRRLMPLALPYPSAEEVSAVRRQPPGLEGQVRFLSSALGST